MTKKVSVLGLVLLTLSGCYSERHARQCEEDYGFVPGTEAYAQCRLKLDTERRANIYRATSLLKR